MDEKELILIIEDERSIAHLIATVLNSHGYETLLAKDGSEGLRLIREQRPHLVLLDLGLPDTDGVDLLRQLREWSQVPVVVVSARSHEKDKITALDLGADDYLTKPFGSGELVARVRTALRHAAGSGRVSRPDTYTVRDLTVDYSRRQILVRGENVKLTQSEYRIVALLAQHAGKVLTYDFIIRELWGDRDGGSNQILRVNMANIRRKIEKNPAEPEYLFTEVGVGYRLAEAE